MRNRSKIRPNFWDGPSIWEWHHLGASPSFWDWLGLSTLDGWWHEGYDGLNGWAIAPSAEGADPDAADAEQLYSLLEEEVVPAFFDRDERGVPPRYVAKMKHALHASGSRFTSRSMVQTYVRRSYAPALRGDDTGDDAPTA